MVIDKKINNKNVDFLTLCIILKTRLYMNNNYYKVAQVV